MFMLKDHVTELQEKEYCSVSFRPIYSYLELHAASRLQVQHAYK